ncbi:hypothetical protein [Kineococcus aurantiacus]|uniref:Uncharacterized protein n=1 Tax=Kineococcus aurantiacus TaxID=37633 RepID=A0A7Y9DQK3_9ACTN|nr:hypothetical protein [Kineococcus aurantiacus]NYD24899.1 hypothetical protein [Kineococcus aurantiacus]
MNSTHSARAARRGSLTALAAAVTVLVLSSPAAATPEPTIPHDVRDLLADEALRQVRSNLAHFAAQPATGGDVLQVPDVSAPLRAGRVHQVYTFTSAWVGGEQGADPAAPTPQWLAPVLRGSDVLGTVRVWKPDGAAAEVAGFNGDVQLGQALQGFADLPVVEDASVGEFFALDGDAVLPVNEASKRELPGEATVDDLQPVVAARVAAGVEAAAGAPDAVGGGGPVDQVPTARTVSRGDRVLLGGGLLLVAGGAAAAVVVARGRRASRRTHSS